MISDTTRQFRALLENEPPAFFDRVDTPWDQVPDLEDYNKQAYSRIVRALKDLKRSTLDPSGSKTQGVLILGEAGTGKTHLLMRVARNLADTNHILFIRKPNNEDAVAQHIWANVVSSLARKLPTKASERSQLDDLLAHVFSKVLIPEFERDIEEDKDADQKRRWVARLQEDPYNLFNMLGEGEKRQDNLDRLRKRTLKYLQFMHPDVDQTIARVLITYCFVVREDRKRVLLTWLAGQDVDEAEAKDLGLPPSWVALDETSADASTQQQREETALRAIRTVGILSTYYQPLILAFDQLEGLRDQPSLTHKWGDAVREIFTMAPNFLVITCIFPSLWETWFSRTLDRSVSERIAQQVVNLENFGPQHGLKLLATHLEASFIKHRLPTNIYPFTNEDVQKLCGKSASPRTFIQTARHEFQSWLDGEDLEAESDGGKAVTKEEIDEVIKTSLCRFEESSRRSFDSEMVIEQDFFGRIRSLTETLAVAADPATEFGKATCRHLVMPPNLIVRHAPTKTSLCMAVMNSEGTSFAARMRNLKKCLSDGDQFTHLIMIRDRRCRRLGEKSQQHLDEAQAGGASYVQAGREEMPWINAVYDTLVAVEEHDLTVGDHEIDKRQLVAYLRGERVLSRTEFFRHAGRHCPALAEAVDGAGQALNAAPRVPLTSAVPDQPASAASAMAKPPTSPAARLPKPFTPRAKPIAEIVVGDDVLDSPHVGLLGELRDGRKKLGISLTKPQCLVLLGYMGSGKSYALGVLIENALLTQPGLIEQTRPMTVVAFNYRRNPQSRFEYGGFAVPNSNGEQVERLASRCGASPMSVETVNVFGYHEELPRRVAEYGPLLETYPIQFRSAELGAEHWEILMKPPSREAEYMDIIRDIIQKLFYQERLTFKNLERAIMTDERLSNTQRRKAMNRLSFADRWISDDRTYEWGDVLQEGTLNIFDLRMQAMEGSEALKLCLIITDLVRRTKNGVNKMVVFDEAHEYVDSKELIGELENAITQIRHDGLSFVLASQFPERIPERIFKYLLTRMIFKLPNAKAISYVQHASPNLAHLSAQKVSNLDLEQGVCFVQTDDDCTDTLMRVPQALEVRPRCTMHGGATIRQVDGLVESNGHLEATELDAEPVFEIEELGPELCPVCEEELVLRQSRMGPVMACKTYPKCLYVRKA